MKHGRTGPGTLQLPILLLAVVGAAACAADLPADERLAMDSARVEAAARDAAADSAAAAAERERAQQLGCAAEFAAQFAPPESALAAEGAKSEDVPDSLRAVVAEEVAYRAGEDPRVAARHGWPPAMPEPLPGSILPCRRIVAYYGNPLSRRMGVLGEYEPDEMLRRFDDVVAEWRAADPGHPVQPALQLIASVAQAEPGRSGLHRLWMADTLVERVYQWARSREALLILDVQVGTSTVQREVPRLDAFLARPDVHLALDPEFAMKDGSVPGTRIGSMDAADVAWAVDHLAAIVREHHLPPKVLVVHRFTRPMLRDAAAIPIRPEVQVVIDMDGWGAAWLKRANYAQYVVSEPVQYTGFKLFYHNDIREPGWTMMTPAEVMRLRPAPLYVQYQ